MKRSSVVSRAFFRRPGVRDLVPDLKLVLVVLTTGCESHTGIYRPAGLAEDTGLDPGALAGGLADLERRGHILRDKQTGEVLLVDWYRDNTFSTPQRRGQWRDDLQQVESQQLLTAALDLVKKNPSCGLTVDNSNQSNGKQQHRVQGEGEGKGIRKSTAPTRSDACSVCGEVGTWKTGGRWFCRQHDHLSRVAA